MSTLWWLMFWTYMVTMVIVMYNKGGLETGIYAVVSVGIIFWWFKRVGFFSKSK